MSCLPVPAPAVLVAVGAGPIGVALGAPSAVMGSCPHPMVSSIVDTARSTLMCM